MIPNSTVPFADAMGFATQGYQQLFDFPVVALVNRDGTPTRDLTRFLRERRAVLPNVTVPLVDRERRPVPVFYDVLRAL